MFASFCICTAKKQKFKPIIQYKNETVFKEYEGTIIAKCTHCHLLKTLPPAKGKKFNPVQSRGEMYDRESKKFNELFIPLIKQIKKFKPRGNVLDIGCSSGLLLSSLKKEGYEVTGIEPNASAYKRSYKKFGKRIFHGTLSNYLKTTKKRFDCIIYNHVLEHIERVDLELKLAKTGLNKNGILLIGVPNTSNIIFFLRQKYWEPLMPREHVWHFNKNYLYHLLDKNGFEVVAVEYENDKRRDYSFKKRLYFQFLGLINTTVKTGEVVRIVAILKKYTHIHL